MALAARETAAEHIRNALTLVAFGGCAEADAITARLRAALREVEAGNMKNPRRAREPRMGSRGTASVKVGQRTYRIPEAWLIGRQRAGRTLWQAIGDWAEQEEMERSMRRNPKPTRKARAFIRRKVRRLAHEGMRAPRRVAAAYSLARRAGFRSVPKRATRRNPARSELEAWDRVEGFARRITRTARNAGVIQDAHNILTVAMQMAAQVRAGVHENPTLAVLGNPPVAATLSDHIYGGSVKYRHKQDGKRYVHHFGTGAKILLLRDGSIQFKHPTKRLWEDM